MGNPSTQVTFSNPKTIMAGTPTSMINDPIRVSATRCTGAGNASAMSPAARCVVVRRLVRLLDRAMDHSLLATQQPELQKSTIQQQSGSHFNHSNSAFPTRYRNLHPTSRFRWRVGGLEGGLRGICYLLFRDCCCVYWFTSRRVFALKTVRITAIPLPYSTNPSLHHSPPIASNRSIG